MPIKKIIPTLLCICCSLQSFAQPVNTNDKNKFIVTFKLTLSTELKNVKNTRTIGIRGNTAPLSWDSTYILTDKDKDGIYEATVVFFSTTDEIDLQYKYFHDTASWENSANRYLHLKKGNAPVIIMNQWNITRYEETGRFKDSVTQQLLYNTITGLDSIFFDSYNNCNLETQASLLSDSIEFYHDKGGLTTSKKDLVAAVKNNICGKVRRELVKGSIEVSPIPGYGAVEMGEHRFYNIEEASLSRPGKFVMIWKYSNGKWQITRVISLH